MSTTSAVSLDTLRERIAALDTIPSIPAILLPLLKMLELPAESIDVQRVVDLIAHDKSLAAQTLHMANSPLFGRMQEVRTIRGAVIALGVSRVREIATSCCMLKMVSPQAAQQFDVRTLWEHSLGVALVSRRFARRIGHPTPEHAYLAGLLHDIGLIVNLILFPAEFGKMGKHAQQERVPMGDAETHIFGFDHAISGAFLAEQWGLSDELKEVIRRHHQVDRAQGHLDLVSLVNIGDLFCRVRGLGYGYDESTQVCFSSEIAWRRLADKFPILLRSDIEKFTFELDSYIDEVRNLVSVLFRMQ